MEAQFWINKWIEGQIGFHKDNVNEALLKHFALFNSKKEDRVLVPLCGKSRDLAWLRNQGLIVHGVELYEKAVEAFFEENNLETFTKKQNQHFLDYSVENLTISCGDFFKLDRQNSYDLIYDRASLVALPFEMRKNYARLLTEVLKKGGRYLLIVYEYNQEEMAGPPFSISQDEINELYATDFDIKLIESETPADKGPKQSGLTQFYQKVYLLKRRS